MKNNVYFTAGQKYLIWCLLDRVKDNLTWKHDCECYSEDYMNWMVSLTRGELWMLTRAINVLKEKGRGKTNMHLTYNQADILSMTLKKIRENLQYDNDHEAYIDDYSGWYFSLDQGDYQVLCSLVNEFWRAVNHE